MIIHGFIHMDLSTLLSSIMLFFPGWEIGHGFWSPLTQLSGLVETKPGDNFHHFGTEHR